MSCLVRVYASRNEKYRPADHERPFWRPTLVQSPLRLPQRFEESNIAVEQTSSARRNPVQAKIWARSAIPQRSICGAEEALEKSNPFLNTGVNVDGGAGLHETKWNDLPEQCVDTKRTIVRSDTVVSSKELNHTPGSIRRRDH
ncbi:hypothetical protein E4U54_002607 [Claviceps lovelessii]|nr:hypothetical protein E4U54_002607 [Claviceps lovelessii]